MRIPAAVFLLSLASPLPAAAAERPDGGAPERVVDRAALPQRALAPSEPGPTAPRGTLAAADATGTNGREQSVALQDSVTEHLWQHADDDDASGPERAALVGFPTLDYNSDRGAGVGAVASYFWFDPVLRPYKSQLFLKLYLSTRLVQEQELRWDLLRPFGLPMRLRARAGFLATRTDNFCGLGKDAKCNPNNAEAAAHDQAASVADVDALARSYYLMRFKRPYGDVATEYVLRERPHQVAVLAGWRGSYVLPGSIGTSVPYPVSLYADVHPDGETGLSSALLVGVTLDNRDREAAPSRGYHVEVALRDANPLWGSEWSWQALYSSGAVFLPLVRDGTWVLAARLMADVIWGNISTVDIAMSGGASSVEAPRFGGYAMGRGIRERRYVGKLNIIQQTELRTHLLSMTLFGQQLEVGCALYADAAWVRRDLDEARAEPYGAVWGAGLGARFLWNEAFALRWDTGVSPAEDYRPKLYIKVGNPF